MEILHKTYPDHPMHQAFGNDPFQMLVAVILSQRATDAMTIPVAASLFMVAPTVHDIAKIDLHLLENIIRPIGFFHQKARALKKLANTLLKKHQGLVPSSESELLALPQVGRKTANIMLTLFFHTPQIAVDVHVHRITHRLGWIATRSVEETEKDLSECIPKKYIPITNQVFVRHGQEICRPIHPKCSQCPIEKYCKKVGLT